MIVVESVRCTGCGSCVRVCHQHCMALVEKRVSIDHALCSTCTQCIAVCPQKALSWDGVPPVDFDPGRMPSAAQLWELLGERRTIRDFSQQKIDRATLEDVVSCGIFAPTHNFHFRCIVVDEPELIALFDTAALQFSRRVYRLLFRPLLLRALVRLAPASLQEEFSRARAKLEAVVVRRQGYACAPAAMVCIIGDKRVPLSLESAQYALYNMTLAAQVRGLGCRSLVGNQMIFNRDREIRRRLRIAKHERIFAIAGFGHPSVTFRNRVMGRKIALQWNSGSVA